MVGFFNGGGELKLVSSTDQRLWVTGLGKYSIIRHDGNDFFFFFMFLFYTDIVLRSSA